MPRGGKRDGAGRPKGRRGVKSEANIQLAAAQGITPLEVMFAAMRAHYDAGRLDKAALVARDCAPYVHPRLSATQISGDVTYRLEVAEEIVDVIAIPAPNPPDDRSTLPHAS